MSTTTKKAPGRPKKAPANTPVETTVKKVESSIKYKEPEPKNLGYAFQAIKGGIVFMLPQSGITLFDEKQNKVREIRYCENMGSIFVDEQGEHARRGSIVFRDGNLFVPPNKPQLTEYLRAHPGNKENGGSSFFEIKKSEKAKITLDNEFDIIEAVSAVRDKSISELLPVAMKYGIGTNQRPAEIRHALLAHAKASPIEFMEAFDSPSVKTRAIIKQCTDFQILKSKEDGYYWFDTNSLIVACPVGQDPLDVMSRFCLTERGASVLMELEDRLAKMD